MLESRLLSDLVWVRRLGVQPDDELFTRYETRAWRVVKSKDIRTGIKESVAMIGLEASLQRGDGRQLRRFGSYTILTSQRWRERSPYTGKRPAARHLRGRKIRALQPVTAGAMSSKAERKRHKKKGSK